MLIAISISSLSPSISMSFSAAKASFIMLNWCLPPESFSILASPCAFVVAYSVVPGISIEVFETGAPFLLTGIFRRYALLGFWLGSS